VGVDDDFYQLGGDSLTAIRVVVEPREELGIPLCVRDLFDTSALPASMDVAIRGAADPHLSPSDLAMWADITAASFVPVTVPGVHQLAQHSANRIAQLIALHLQDPHDSHSSATTSNTGKAKSV
jgi:hypothetical protein